MTLLSEFWLNWVRRVSQSDAGWRLSVAHPQRKQLRHLLSDGGGQRSTHEPSVDGKPPAWCSQQVRLCGCRAPLISGSNSLHRSTEWRTSRGQRRLLSLWRTVAPTTISSSITVTWDLVAWWNREHNKGDTSQMVLCGLYSTRGLHCHCSCLKGLPVLLNLETLFFSLLLTSTFSSLASEPLHLKQSMFWQRQRHLSFY